MPLIRLRSVVSCTSRSEIFFPEIKSIKYANKENMITCIGSTEISQIDNINILIFFFLVIKLGEYFIQNSKFAIRRNIDSYCQH